MVLPPGGWMYEAQHVSTSPGQQQTGSKNWNRGTEGKKKLKLTVNRNVSCSWLSNLSCVVYNVGV